MDYRTYAEQAILTVANRDTADVFYHVDHAIIGLNTEIGELRENLAGERSVSNIKEECGDICWYAALYAWATQSSFEGLFLPDDTVFVRSITRALDNMHIHASIALDVTKKALYYGKERDLDLITRSFRECIAGVQTLCHIYGLSVGGVLEANNYKLLKKRYPEREFKADRALNRDLAAEQAALKNT